MLPGNDVTLPWQRSHVWGRQEKLTFTLCDMRVVSLRKTGWWDRLSLIFFNVLWCASHTFTHTHSYICTHIHTHSNTHSRVHTFTHTYIHTHSHTIKHTHIHTHIHSIKHTHIRTHTLKHTFTHTFTHSRTHRDTHTFTHTHRPAASLAACFVVYSKSLENVKMLQIVNSDYRCCL